MITGCSHNVGVPSSVCADRTLIGFKAVSRLIELCSKLISAQISSLLMGPMGPYTHTDIFFITLVIFKILLSPCILEYQSLQLA